MNIMNHTQTPDLVRRFQQCRLAVGDFSHRNHIFVARWYLLNYGLAAGAERYAGDIKRLAEAVGHGKKFHATITHALLQLIGERLSSGDGEDWQVFEINNRDLFEDAKALRLARYSAKTLDCEAARRGIVEPDYPLLEGVQAKNCNSANRV